MFDPYRLTSLAVLRSPEESKCPKCGHPFAGVIENGVVENGGGLRASRLLDTSNKKPLVEWDDGCKEETVQQTSGGRPLPLKIAPLGSDNWPSPCSCFSR